jgi:hypothetical protein
MNACQPGIPSCSDSPIAFHDPNSPAGRRLCPRTRLVMREVEVIDLDARKVL